MSSGPDLSIESPAKIYQTPACMVHEQALKSIQRGLDDIKKAQDENNKDLRGEISSLRESQDAGAKETREQIDRLWRNGLNALGEKLSAVDRRVVVIETRDGYQDKQISRLFEADNFFGVIKSIPGWAKGLSLVAASVALTIWGPELVKALGSLLG